MWHQILLSTNDYGLILAPSDEEKKKKENLNSQECEGA